MYARAANLFKMAKKWGQAGNTFNTIAQHHVKAGSKHDAATNLIDAANCYRKTDPKEATTTFQKAIDIYTEMGRFTIAAKHHQTIAEICEVSRPRGLRTRQLMSAVDDGDGDMVGTASKDP